MSLLFSLLSLFAVPHTRYLQDHSHLISFCFLFFGIVFVVFCCLGQHFVRELSKN
ncbi:hypothetical protein CROQUDRAFT_653819 [Cronartium quercuum f. sp. fusiforme G11]|uniref:Uncharacterized protein n=1 Tax=Cronartium quercuum f. sp. fusiforme G11 TaxID=708437 RepID=A0A9P6NLH1_9BASI|nr:hypothetical protein CROQUDRAFT_653819 [Cronartium quercuum f. sp. fusiforme G11]